MASSKTLFLTIMIICIASGMVSVSGADGKLCFISNYCPTAPEQCDHFCKASLGKPKGGSCSLGICCCHL
ncbi:unnamed protein product [Lathyrus oleraceus]